MQTNKITKFITNYNKKYKLTKYIREFVCREFRERKLLPANKEVVVHFIAFEIQPSCL